MNRHKRGEYWIEYFKTSLFISPSHRPTHQHRQSLKGVKRFWSFQYIWLLYERADYDSHFCAIKGIPAEARTREIGKYFNALRFSHFRVSGNWFYFSINASEFFSAVRSGNSIKALSVPLSIRLSVDAAMRMTKSNLATDDYSIFFTQKLFYFVEALQM